MGSDDYPLPEWCPCADIIDYGGRGKNGRHKLNKPIGAHICVTSDCPDDPRKYAAIVPVCDNCNRTGHEYPIIFACQAVTIVDPGCMTMAGRIICKGDGRTRQFEIIHKVTSNPRKGTIKISGTSCKNEDMTETFNDPDNFLYL